MSDPVFNVPREIELTERPRSGSFALLHRRDFRTLYAAMFIPVTYWVDGMVYKRWQKRKTGGDSAGKNR